MKLKKFEKPAGAVLFDLSAMQNSNSANPYALQELEARAKQNLFLAWAGTEEGQKTIKKGERAASNEKLRATSERPIIQNEETGTIDREDNASAGYVSGTDPVGEFYVTGVALDPAFKLAGEGLSWLGRNYVTPWLTKIGTNVAEDGVLGESRRFSLFGKDILNPFSSTDHSLDYRLVRGKDLYAYRAERLGVTPERYMEAKNLNKVFTELDYKNWLIKQGVSEEKAAEHALYSFSKERLGPSMHPYTKLDGTKTGVIYNNIQDNYYKGLSDDIALDRLAISDNHEFTHLRQFRHGDESDAFVSKALNEAGISDVDDVFYNLIESLNQGIHPETDDYLRGNGMTEIIARIGQLKDAIGLRANEPFTMEMFNYLKNNYARKFMDNNMQDLFKFIKDPNKFVKFMNTPSVRKYAGLAAIPIATSAAAPAVTSTTLSLSQRFGGKLNYLNYINYGKE